MRNRVLLWLLALALLLPGVAPAQNHGKGQQKHVDADAQEQDNEHERGKVQYDAHGNPVFSARDRDTISRFFREDYSNLPPGLAKRNGNLPPGLQKQLERNGTLPPGLQKRVQPFPSTLEVRLPRLPDIYARVILGRQAIILDRRTQRILDIIHDITRP